MPRQRRTNFGNFEFDGLTAGKYTLDFEGDGRPRKTMEVELEKDLYLAEIMF